MLAKKLRKKLDKKLEKESLYTLYQWSKLKNKIKLKNAKRLDFCSWYIDARAETNEYIYKKLKEEGFVYKNRGYWIIIEW